MSLRDLLAPGLYGELAGAAKPSYVTVALEWCMDHLRKAKIVATVGPASRDPDTIAAMARAGMDVARINTSHTDAESLPEYIEAIEEARERVDRPIGIMVDIQGPEIRTGRVDEPVELVEGETATFVEGAEVTGERVGLTIDVGLLAPGERIVLDDGRIETTVESVEDGTVTARVEAGGVIDRRVGVNLPGVDIDAEIPTEKDRQDLDIAVDRDVDFVAVSFVRDASDIYAVIDHLEVGDDDPFVIGKIERAAAVDNLDGIIRAADGIMVARGDLGVECPLEDVPTIQKRIIHACRDQGVPVITATEMLESMIHGRRPTRAEASDVANAVLDGTDAVMLSGETAVGDHPVHVIRMMDTIINSVEGSEEYRDILEQRVPQPSEESAESLSRAARSLVQDVGATAIVVESESGYTARKAAKFRPNVPIVATTPSQSVARKLVLSWGVHAAHTELDGDSTDEIISSAVDTAVRTGAVVRGDTVVVMAGMFRALEEVRTTDMLKIHVVADRLAAGTGIVPGHGTGPLVHVADGDLSGVDAGAVVAFPASFEGEIEGDIGKVAGIVYGRPGRMSSVAVASREHGVPLVCGADVTGLPEETVTVDAVRGVVYRGEVRHRNRRTG